MKTNKLVLSLALAAASFTTAHAQTWQTVDTFPPSDADYRSIATDSAGRVFRAGRDSGRAAVRRSQDGGVTWDTTHLYPVPATDSEYSWFSTVATSPDGTVYAGGVAHSNGDVHVNDAWIVWRSVDHGDTWTLIDEQIPGYTAQARSVATDTAGNVYVAGILNTRRSGAGWSVRKGVPDLTAPNGVRWTQIDNYQLQKSYNSQAYAIATRVSPVAGQPDEIYVGGQGNSRAGGFWTVRRSLDGGVTWATIASYQMVKNSGNNFVNGFAINSTGEIFASGRISTSSSGGYFWIVRKSSDGGTTWGNVDVFNPAGALGSIANDVTVDAFGRVFVVGNDWQGNSNDWIVRASADGGATWTTTEFFEGVAGGVASDPEGNVYVTGWGIDGTAARKLSAPAP